MVRNAGKGFDGRNGKSWRQGGHKGRWNLCTTADSGECDRLDNGKRHPLQNLHHPRSPSHARPRFGRSLRGRNPCAEPGRQTQFRQVSPGFGVPGRFWGGRGGHRALRIGSGRFKITICDLEQRSRREHQIPPVCIHGTRHPHACKRSAQSRGDASRPRNRPRFRGDAQGAGVGGADPDAARSCGTAADHGSGAQRGAVRHDFPGDGRRRVSTAEGVFRREALRCLVVRPETRPQGDGKHRARGRVLRHHDARHSRAKRGGADVTVATSQKSATRFLCPMAIEKFNQQNPTLSVRTTGVFHDRFLILDGKELYHFGASLKDLGRLYCAVSKMDAGFIPSILARI